jgi:serine protease Do
MKFPYVYRCAFGLMLVLATSMLAPDGALAQDLGRDGGRDSDVLKPEQFKDGTAVRKAFDKVVENAADATVEISIDQRQVALGLIVGSDGWIVTKASELNDPKNLVVKFKDGRWTKAKLVGTDRRTDLALLKLTARRLAVVPWSQARSHGVGRIVASSAPTDHPVAVGVISLPNRIVPRIKPVIGVGLMPSETGPRIDRVYPKSGAAKAGLKRHDVITSANGRATVSREILIKVLTGMEVGQKVRLGILRGKKTFEVEVLLGQPADIFAGSPMALQNRLGGKLSVRRNNFSQVIQHDTVLLPNQVGGPLVALDGKVIGINIARADRTASYAIPTHLARPVIDRLKAAHISKMAKPRSTESTGTSSKPTKD